MNTEEKYPEIREKLRKLPRIKARDDFLNRLLNRINLLENQPLTVSHPKKEEHDKEFHLEKPLSEKILEKFSMRKPVWLIPTVSFAVILLVVFSYLLYVRNTDTQQETVSAPQLTQETETKTPSFKEEPKTDKLTIPEPRDENLQYSEAREDVSSKKQVSKEPPKVTNESGVVAPLERKEPDLKTEAKPEINGKNNDEKDLQEADKKLKADEKTKEKITDTKGKVEVSKTKSAVVPAPPKKKIEIEKEGFLEEKKKTEKEIKPDSLKK